MLSIEPLLTGYDSTGHANYLVLFNFSTVQEYIDSSAMSISGIRNTVLKYSIRNISSLLYATCTQFSTNL